MGFGDWVKSPFKMAESFFNPERGYEKAGNELQKYFREAQGYGLPFFEASKGQLPFLERMRDLLANPGALEREWLKGYETSPEAQDLLRRMSDYGASEASSMGLSGSSAALENAQRTAGSIVSQDRQRYMNDLMDKFLKSIGISGDIYGAGANVAGGLSRNAMDFGGNKAGLTYGQYAAPGNRLGQLIGGAAALYGGGGKGAF